METAAFQTVSLNNYTYYYELFKRNCEIYKANLNRLHLAQDFVENK